MPSDRRHATAARSAGLTVLTQVWTALVGLGLIVILTRVLSKEDIGRFALLIGAYEVLDLFGTLGIPHSLLHFIPIDSRDRARSIGVGSALLMTGVALVIAGGVAVAAPFVSLAFESSGDAPFEPLLRWLALYIGLGLPTAMTAPYLIATGRPQGALRYTVFQQAIRFGAVVVPALLGAPITTIVICLAASSVLPLVAMWILLLMVERHLPLRVDWRQLKAQLSYGWPQAASVGVQRFNRWIDKYTIGLLMPFDAVGVYTNCSRELPVVRNIPNGATTGIIPELSKRHSEGDSEGFLALWRALMVKVSLFAFPAFAFTFTMAPALIEVLFTKEYLSGVGLFRLYLLVLPLRLCIYGGILRAMGDTRTLLRSIIVATVLNLVLNYPLFLLMGWNGPALATVISEVVTIVLLVGKSAQYLGTKVLNVFPWAELGRAALATLFATVPCWAVTLLQLPAVLSLVLAAVVFLPSFVLIGRQLGVISRRDYQYLVSLLGRG